MRLVDIEAEVCADCVYRDKCDSLEYLQQCLVELVEAKNNGYIKMADIEKALHGEYKLVNSAE